MDLALASMGVMIGGQRGPDSACSSCYKVPSKEGTPEGNWRGVGLGSWGSPL